MSKPKTNLAVIIIVVVFIAVAIAAGIFYLPNRTSISFTTTLSATPSISIFTTAATYSFKMPTGSSTGSLYIVGQAISAIVSKYNPHITLVAIPGGGSVSNARLVGKGDALIAASGSIFAYYAYKGLPPFFANESYPKIRVLAPIHPNLVGFIVRADSGMKSIYDLTGKRVAVAEPGSGDNALAMLLLKESGILDKVVTLNVGEPDSWNMLKAGQVDAVIMFTALPNPSLYEFSMTCPITLLEIPDELANTLQSKYPFLSRAYMPKNTYNGVDKDIPLLKVQMVVIANSDLPDDVAYDIVKTYWTHFDEVVKMASFLQYVDKNEPLKGLGVPLHRGAYKFWNEAGYKIPEELIPPELKYSTG